MFYYDTFDDEENNTRARILNKEETKQNKNFYFLFEMIIRRSPYSMYV